MLFLITVDSFIYSASVLGQFVFVTWQDKTPWKKCEWPSAPTRVQCNRRNIQQSFLPLPQPCPAAIFAFCSVLGQRYPWYLLRAQGQYGYRLLSMVEVESEQIQGGKKGNGKSKNCKKVKLDQSNIVKTVHTVFCSIHTWITNIPCMEFSGIKFFT